MMIKLLAASLFLALPALAEDCNKSPCKAKQVIIQNCNSNAKVTSPKVIYKTKYLKSKPKTIVKLKEVKVVVEKKVERKLLKNKVKLLGGFGRSGVKAYKSGNTGVAKSVNGGVLGVGYEIRINKRLSVGVDVLSNKTYLLEAGLHF